LQRGESNLAVQRCAELIQHKAQGVAGASGLQAWLDRIAPSRLRYDRCKVDLPVLHASWKYMAGPPQIRIVR
jgi:hypothetical protein